MDKNLTNNSLQSEHTNLIRGGTGYPYVPFELKLQLHGQVGNSYTVSVKEDYESSAEIISIPYTEQNWTNAGSYIFTVPKGISKIRVALCAGGGGGAGAATLSPSQSYTGGTGGNSSFGSYYTVTGGTGGYANKNGSCSAGIGGTPNGKNGTTSSNVSGHSSTTSGGSGWSLNFNQASGSYGAGGGAVASSYTSWLGGGGSGGYYSGYFNVKELENITITVGNYGVLGDTDDSRAHGYNGASGFVLIAYGQGIE